MPVDNSTKTKISEGRKSSKPLMEKRRRARINDSLGQLKTLILEATNKDSSRHSKLEKADILEMTVKYLRNMQRHQIASALATDPSLLGRYRAGYNECIGEVSRFLNSAELNTEVQTKLIGHLASTCRPPASQSASYATTTTQSVNSVQTSSPISTNSTSSPAHPIQVQFAQPQQISSATNVQTIAVNHNNTISQLNNSSSVMSLNGNESNVARVLSGIPIGLQSPTGEITVVLPPQAVTNGQIPSHYIPVYAQSAPLLTPPPSLGSPSSSLGSPNATSPQSIVQSKNGGLVDSRFMSYPHTSTSPIVIANQHQTPGPMSVVLHQQAPACYTVATSPVQHVPVEDEPVKMIVCNPNPQLATESVWRPW